MQRQAGVKGGKGTADNASFRAEVFVIMHILYSTCHHDISCLPFFYYLYTSLKKVARKFSCTNLLEIIPLHSCHGSLIVDCMHIYT